LRRIEDSRVIATVSIVTSSATVSWPARAANTLDMRNAVHPFFVLNLEQPKT